MGATVRAATGATEQEDIVSKTSPRIAGRTAASRDAERLSWDIVESPLGPLLTVGSARGLLRIAFGCEGFDAVLGSLQERTGAVPRRVHDRLGQVGTELDEYFAGTRRGFDLALDHSASTGFRAQVQHLLPHTPYGRTITYKQLAGAAGSPRAVRAVGGACATNPLPIVVPCHRVVRSDGGLGGYLGGLEAKRILLDLESGTGVPAGTRDPAGAHS